MGCRDGLLAELAGLAGLLVVFGADPVDDPGVGELADIAAVLAGEDRASTPGEGIREAGALLDQDAAELRAADRFRGTLLPVVVRHLRRAAAFLASACARLGSAAGAVADGPARAAAAW
ncbi:hypothetical protein [Kitasatospora sp. MBT63]|uniref:hypothetical protein n=1 Tax=Kitasatospora sp. MBT63 TaxID=1444768 RepID=UPI00053A5C8D|nr:hypothetical protein [Kitasatospora sp. MBT63]